MLQVGSGPSAPPLDPHHRFIKILDLRVTLQRRLSHEDELPLVGLNDDGPQHPPMVLHSLRAPSGRELARGTESSCSGDAGDSPARTLRLPKHSEPVDAAPRLKLQRCPVDRRDMLWRSSAVRRRCGTELHLKHEARRAASSSRAPLPRPEHPPSRESVPARSSGLRSPLPAATPFADNRDYVQLGHRVPVGHLDQSRTVARDARLV